MRNPYFTLMVSGILVLCAILVLPAGVLAIQLPPPPDKTPIVIPTDAPTAAPTDAPTAAPTEPPTEAPTQAPTDEPTVEPTEAPTQEPIAKPTSAPTEAPVENPSSEGRVVTSSKPDPNCQAMVAGTVTEANGRPIAGVEVSLTGEGLERKILTGDAGNYGFGGLCAGTVTLVAAMPGGKISPAATLEVDGQGSFVVNLGFGSDAPKEAPLVEESATAPVPPQSLADQEPTMPATGFPGIYLLAGGAILGMLLTITFGIWRTVQAHQDQ